MSTTTTPTTVKAFALWLHELGANVTAVDPLRGLRRSDELPRVKSPIHQWKHLRTQRQTSSELRTYPWHRASGVGLIAGAGGFRVFDIDHAPDDRPLRALLAALRLPADYPWRYRSGSGEGWGLVVRCDEDIPPDALPSTKNDSAVFWGWPPDDAGYHHLELRWNQHCILPPSAYVFAKEDDPRHGTAGPGYQWCGDAPTDAPALVSVGRVIDAFYALCPPKAEPVDRATVDDIRRRFDLVAYAREHFGGDEQAEGSEVRFCGHGGLLVRPDSGVWSCFADEIGGDALDLVAWRHYRTTSRNLNGKFHEVLKEAAAYAGVRLPAPSLPPAPTTTPTAPTTPTTTPVGVEEERRPRFTIRTEDDLSALPPPSWLVPGEILRGAYHLVYGASGSGKTFYAIDRALRAASAGARCLYIATEDLIGLKVRVAAWRATYPQAAGRLIWLDMPEGLDLGDPGQVRDLLATVGGLELDLITIDTLREAHTGDENSSQDMAAVNRAVQRLIRETGASVDVVHHSGVNEGRERGSTALGANCDIKWKVSNDDGRICITCEKYRHGAPFDPRYYQIEPVGVVDGGAVLRPSSATSGTTGAGPVTPGQRSILDMLALSIFSEIGAKTAQIEAHTGLKGGSLFRALSSLKNRGLLTQGGKGDPYTITAAGRAEIGPSYQPAPGYDDATTTEYSASVCPTTTTTTQLPPTTTVVPTHSLPTTTTTTTRKGGSGGSWSGRWEAEVGDDEDLFPAPPAGDAPPPSDDDQAETEAEIIARYIAEEEARHDIL